MNTSPLVIIPPNISPLPESHEIEIAWILALYFHESVEFVIPSKGYKMKSPDVLIRGVPWEFKSPTGSSRKATIEYQFKGLYSSQSTELLLNVGRRGCKIRARKGRATRIGSQRSIPYEIIPVPPSPRRYFYISSILIVL